MSKHANDSGRVPVTFRMRDGWSDRPVELPCGKCVGCLKDKASAWAVRCYHESTLHVQNSFLTLTYNDENLPSKLQVDDLQKFFKRMRKRGLKFRYFACGEYGGRTLRPHFHALIFGQDFLSDSVPLGLGDDQYTSRLVDETWGLGFSVIRSVTPDACFYTTGYTLKNAGRDDCFHVASKRPYIGHGWLAQYFDNISRLGHVVIDGRRFPVPLAYLTRPEFALEFDALREERREHVRRMSPDDVWKRRQMMPGKEENLIARSSIRRTKV